MHSKIQQILDTTKTRIRAFGPEIGLNGMPECMQRRDFLSAVAAARKEGRVPLVAEVKPASPGKAFREILPEDAARLAWEMEEAGAVAISVLTEPEVFRGSLENLESVRRNVCLPVLRKDFIIDRLQLEESRSDLILLIAGILGENLLDFVDLALKKGLEPLVEVHNEEELKLALETPARVIGINNRNLETLEISLETTEKLAPLIREYDRENGTKHVIVSESGIRGPEDVHRVIDAGADAVLVGSVIMENESVFEKTKELVQSLAWRW